MTSSTSPTTSGIDAARGPYDSDKFDEFRLAVRARFTKNAEHQPVFRTAPPPHETLFDIYLRNLPEDQRQTCTCNTCRSFMKHYGGLVTIDAVTGVTKSALWALADAPSFYKPAVAAMIDFVEKARVVGMCITSTYELGTQVTGIWTHFSLRMSGVWVHKSATVTAGQAMAAKLENYGVMRRALGEFDAETANTAVTLLETGAFDRPEKVLGPAKFLRDVRAIVSTSRDRRLQDNLVWRAIATAPEGFCHPRSSMIGTLLEDLEKGTSGEQAMARFNAKMHPTAYQRPTAAPSAGTVARAEKLVEQLGIAPSLRRRYARLDEVQTLWTPPAPTPTAKKGGVFEGLAADSKPAARDVATAPQRITFLKFLDTVVPTAQEMRVDVHNEGWAPFMALLTAEDAAAPPILQWDKEELRNPVSLYTYTNASQLIPARWGIKERLPRVTAISYRPHMWNGAEADTSHRGKGAILLLEGCCDEGTSGSALFPEFMRSELHEVRSVIEAYSRKNNPSGREQASACGVYVGGLQDVTVQVRNGRVLSTYIIDRWD